MSWFDKLKAEWKTFALAVATTMVGFWDAVHAYGYDYTPIISPQYQPYAVPLIGIGFLTLRKYVDKK